MSDVLDQSLFLNDYRHGVDDKRRVSIPADWRAPLGQETIFYVFLWDKDGQPPCLHAMPPEGMKAMLAKLQALSEMDPDVESLKRLLGRSAKLVADKVGRVCLPEQLAKAAELGKEVILKGMVNRFQIWHPEHLAVATRLDLEKRNRLNGMI